VLVVLFDGPALVATRRRVRCFAYLYRFVASVRAGEAHHDGADFLLRNCAHGVWHGRVPAGAYDARGMVLACRLGGWALP
jgi:hypothetical protein